MKINWRVLMLTLPLLCAPAMADTMQWNLPFGVGTVQIPYQVSDALPVAGYDFVQNKSIAGVAASVLTLFKEIHGYAGLVGEFHSNTPNLQPYAAFGSDVSKYIPGLNQITSLQIHGFGRYDPGAGGAFHQHLGAGLSAAYRYGGFTPVKTSRTPFVRSASRLNLIDRLPA